MVRKLKEVYETYVREAEKAYRDAGPVDGLFGWGEDPRKDPCHMRFYEGVEAWVRAFRASEPDREESFAAVSVLLRMPQEHRKSPCFWFMFAAQGLGVELIEGLNGEQCAQLRDFFDEAYPKRERMPVQKDVYRRLKKGAGRN